MNVAVPIDQVPVTYQQLFQASLQRVPLIPYDKTWENGTGYFDNLAKRKTEMTCKSYDPSGRPILMIPDDEGTIVVFQRFASDGRLCFHIPVVIERNGDAFVSASGETMYSCLDNLSESAKDRQLEARMALLATAIRAIHPGR